MMSVKPQKVINPAPLKFVPSYLSQEEKNTIMNLSSYSTVFGRQLLSCLSKYQVTYSETKIISLITLLMQLVLINYKPIKFFKYAKDNDDHLYNFRVDCATITINYFEAIDHMVKEMIPAKNGDLLVYLNGLLETLF
jgi:hypothetical protein